MWFIPQQLVFINNSSPITSISNSTKLPKSARCALQNEYIHAVIPSLLPSQRDHPIITSSFQFQSNQYNDIPIKTLIFTQNQPELHHNHAENPYFHDLDIRNQLDSMIMLEISYFKPLYDDSFPGLQQLIVLFPFDYLNYHQLHLVLHAQLILK